MNGFTDLLNGITDGVTGGDPLPITNGIILLVTGLLAVAAVAAVGWMLHRASRSVARGNWSGRRVLIVTAVVVAFAVAGIGGVQSFRAVSVKFDSPLVPLVADGMVIACTALRLAALTRGWRIPGALFTTYLFIGGTVALNIDAANGKPDVAIAHALAPLAYAVLVEMLAHMLRLHLKLSQPARPKLSALTWITSPVITTRVWLHLARTGAEDPIEARALVQQVVRMSSRLNTVCPSRRGLPLDSARAARSAALQTIRDGLLTAGELAALLPTTRRIAAGELLALVDSAALGLPVTDDPDAERPAVQQVPAWLVLYLLAAARRDQIRPADLDADDAADSEVSDEVVEESADAGELAWPLMVGYVFGALLQQSNPRSEHLVPEQSTWNGAPLHNDNGADALLRATHTGAPSPERTGNDQSSRMGAGEPVHLPGLAPQTAPVTAPVAAPAARDGGASLISAPVAETDRPAQSSPVSRFGSGAGGGAGKCTAGRGKRSDDSYVAELVEVSRRDHGGEPLGLREITRVAGVGFPKAARLAALAGWRDAEDGGGSQSVANGHDGQAQADAESNEPSPEPHQPTNEAHELEMSKQ
ncbi:DUF2637 domain-containing protein [Kribbella sindirgiensis]|uniref:DUF2637 domain-containing protein n=1 Tax=Kribbella sindirgiensis TaxID=1124744 RepID=A0A4R0J1S9_9ACTN|nr:DUF2637 domain-containing protein [Kribbella sindirgiensis]TCC35095.1 DUF2637 domain-containing protein [Kribbella sindirgiensis]